MQLEASYLVAMSHDDGAEDGLIVASLSILFASL